MPLTRLEEFALAFGKALLINSGTRGYGAGSERSPAEEAVRLATEALAEIDRIQVMPSETNVAGNLRIEVGDQFLTTESTPDNWLTATAVYAYFVFAADRRYARQYIMEVRKVSKQ